MRVILRDQWLPGPICGLLASRASAYLGKHRLYDSVMECLVWRLRVDFILKFSVNRL
jgi:hypothetical protein